MRQRSKSFVNLMLGIMTCLILVSFSTPAMSKDVAALWSAPTKISNGVAIAPSSEAIAAQLSMHLQAAETVLLAQAEPAPPAPIEAPSIEAAPMSGTTIARYVAVMSGKAVAPSASTYAFGSAGAALIGNRLVIRGDYSGLSSPLRDYATDPVNPPNPNITSGIHVHKGEPSKNGPFQYALTVEPGANQLSGRLMGEYTLTEEQLQALTNGTLYMDLHTKQNRAGELRGIFKAY